MQRKPSSPASRLSPPVITLIIIGCTVGIVLFLYAFRQSLISRQASTIDVKSGNPALESQVSKIASEFLCTCGTCSNETLDQCVCENAQKGRQIIRTSLQAGRSHEEIVATIESSYGERIPGPAGISDIGQTLSISQRSEILSHFRCPCGKCGMDNLAECECDHPRGGREVRRFLDQRLSEKQYSTGQLIAEIEKVYGGKRF